VDPNSTPRLAVIILPYLSRKGKCRIWALKYSRATSNNKLILAVWSFHLILTMLERSFSQSSLHYFRITHTHTVDSVAYDRITFSVSRYQHNTRLQTDSLDMSIRNYRQRERRLELFDLCTHSYYYR